MRQIAQLIHAETYRDAISADLLNQTARHIIFALAARVGMDDQVVEMAAIRIDNQAGDLARLALAEAQGAADNNCVLHPSDLLSSAGLTRRSDNLFCLRQHGTF